MASSMFVVLYNTIALSNATKCAICDVFKAEEGVKTMT